MKNKFYKKMCFLLLAFTLFFSEAVTAQAMSPVGICSDQEWEVLKLVNRERLNKNLAPLSVMGSLQEASDVRSVELSKEFSHTRPNGSSFFTSLQGISYNSAGENIAAGYSSSAEVMEGWMNSPGHKANILGKGFTHLGVGYYGVAAASHHYWSQIFIGNCMPVAISVNKAGKPEVYPRGTTVEAMKRLLTVTCRHGVSYLPLTDKMCSGYNRDTTGKKKIKVNYLGKSISFRVKLTGIDIRRAKITNIKNKKYNRKPQTQNPKVTLNGKTLVKNRDYTISYKHNKNKGKAVMVITGKGIYSGTAKRRFKITKR